MPVQWTAESDQRLFLIISDTHKLDHKAIADEWKKRYAHEGADMPSAGAISQHIDKTKRKQAGKAKGGTTNGTAPKASRKAPVTPRKPTATKTPTSSAKRKRTPAMSDQDDSEPDLSKVKLSQEDGVSRRGSLSRASKESPKKYEDPSEDEEADDEAENGISGLSKAPKDDGDIFGGTVDFDGATDVKPAAQSFDVLKDWRGNEMQPRKTFNRSGLVGSGDESDGSNFSESFK